MGRVRWRSGIRWILVRRGEYGKGKEREVDEGYKAIIKDPQVKAKKFLICMYQY